jgi:hypothetical protein
VSFFISKKRGSVFHILQSGGIGRLIFGIEVRAGLARLLDPPQRGASLIAVSCRRQRNAYGCPAVARIDVNPAVVVEDRAFDNRQA